MGTVEDKASETSPMAELSQQIVVGIGGSAGGLDALEHILSALPGDSGLAFAVALHSSPDRAEALADFLGRYSPMPTLAVGERAVLQPNTIHIIRYDKNQDGTLYRIDRFFHRLAVEYGNRAIAVVLSGGGADGADGARAIAAQGGTILVQDPASAPHPEMPQNTLLACPTAQALSPEFLATKVLEIARVTEGGPPEEEIADQLRAIFRIVKARTGNDFSDYKPNTVLRRIDRRMKANGLTDVDGYVRLLDVSLDEAQALSRDFCIGVTVFFRDPEAFEILRRDVIPKLFANRTSDDPVRIWDTCCATGEETYSLAMLIQEYLAEKCSGVEAKLFATDLDDTAIANARIGMYPQTAMLDLGENRLDTFFHKVDGGYQVVKSLREMIIFAQHNLVKDPPFSRLDMIVCRNFFIYLNTNVQKRLLTLFHSMLRPGGYLFMGNSESLGTLTDLFLPVDKRWRIFQRRGTDRRPSDGFPVTRHMQTIVRGARVNRPEVHEPGPGVLAEKILVERFAPPCVVVNDQYEVVYVSTPTSHLLEIPTGEPTQDLFRMVKEELRPALRAAIHKALSQGQQVGFRAQNMTQDGQTVAVNVTSEPLGSTTASRKLALVTLQPVVVAHGVSPRAEDLDAIPLAENSNNELIRSLEEQLHISQEELNATIEQLATSNDSLISTNEELMSVNEEFQSTNEELETSKEELQTLNEELITLNTELQHKVDALDAANNDIENLLNGTQIATIFLDCHLRVKRFTPAALEIFNLIPSDIDRPFEHITGNISHVDISADAQTVIDTQTSFDRSVSSIAGDRFYLMRLLPYLTSKGKVEGVVATFVDLTDRRKMEESLREQAKILDLAPVMIRDLEGRIVLWNTGAERLYGFKKEEALGRVSHQLLGSVFSEPLEQIMETLYARDSWDGELIRRSRDGQEICVMSQWVLYRDSNGCPSRVLETNTDITERKNAEEQYHILFCEMIDGFARQEVIFSEEGEAVDYRFLTVNPAFERITGLRADEVIGRTLFAVMPGIESFGGELCRRAAMLGEPAHFIHDNLQLDKRFEISVFRPAAGQIAMIFLDMTTQYKAESERAKLEVQLRQAQKMESIGVLAGGIAHDFNNILAAIMGFTELARDATQPGSRIIQDLDRVMTSAHRAKDLVKQILAFSRQSNVELMPIKIQPVVKESLKMLRASIPTTITIKEEIHPQAGVVLADPTQVQQIVMNLCTNAYHAMEEAGGVLSVRVRETFLGAPTVSDDQQLIAGDFVELMVSDTGTGIAPDVIDKIFDPYFTTKAIGKGSGMGLSITHGIIKSYGGDITVESTLGQGTTFYAYFPLVQEETEPLKETHDEAPGGNERILFVDDEELLAELGQAMLGRLGYRVTVRRSGVEALETFMCAPDQFDVVITDQTMPEMTGSELARRILHVRPELPIILCTGFGQTVSEASAKAIGIRQLAFKPLTNFSIAQLIRSVLDG